jgi:Tol biopolymer transport system component
MTTLAAPVARDPGDLAPFAAGGSGIAFVRSRFESRLVWLDRFGHESGVVSGPGQYESPAVSPGGRRIAFSHRDRARGIENLDVWTADLDGRNRSRLTFDGSVDIEPVWSPDGRRIVFRSNRSGASDLYMKRVDGDLPETLLYASPARKDACDWSPDGTRIVFALEVTGSESDLWVLPVDAPQLAAPLVSGPGSQGGARFSPDGKLLAYASTENDASEVFVQSLGPSRRRWKVGRGVQPMWRADGRELMFLDGSTMMAAAVSGDEDATAFAPGQPLFTSNIAPAVRNAYAIAPDGRRFLAIAPFGMLDDSPLTLLLHPFPPRPGE